MSNNTIVRIADPAALAVNTQAYFDALERGQAYYYWYGPSIYCLVSDI